MIASTIKAKCRNCGCEAPAEQFKLHYQLKQMVCEKCFRDQNSKNNQNKASFQRKEPPKPLGWDEEDDYLEKAAKLREQEIKGKFTKIPGTNQVQYKCFSCKFSFKYDPFKKMPYTCPYCNKEIPKLKTFNLL